MNFLLVGCGGFFGAMLRYGVSRAVMHILPGVFPVGTLLVNASGSLLMGFLTALFLKGQFSSGSMLLFATGFLGGFTTFSAFSIETVNLYNAQQYSLCLLNMFISPVLSVFAAYAGLKIFV